MLAIAIDRRNEFANFHAAFRRDFPNGIPESVFKAHAGLVARKQHRPFHYGRFFLRTFHVPTRWSRGICRSVRGALNRATTLGASASGSVRTTIFIGHNLPVGGL